MSQNMRAFILLINNSAEVTCSQCGHVVKSDTVTPNIPRLARLGCPKCHCTKFSYTMPEELAARVLAAVPS